MPTLTRRQALALGGLTLAAGAAVGAARYPWPDAPPGADHAGRALPTPPDLPMRRTRSGEVQAGIVAASAPVQVAGTRAALLTYNGSVPGPTLRLREGDHVGVRFTNQLAGHGNLHLHGLHVAPAADAPFAHLMPGESRDYTFVVQRGSAGTYWYHPHPHGMVAGQLFAGLAGGVVVRGEIDDSPELRAAAEHLLVLKDFTLSRGQISPHTMFDLNGKEGNLLTVNGAWQPVLSAKKRTLRLRLINASAARYFRLKLDGHPLHLIGTDGGFVERPVEFEELLLAPGERADVLVQLRSGGSDALSDLGYDREGGRATAQPLLTVRSPSTSVLTPLPSRLAEIEQLDTSRARVRTVTLNQSFPLNYGMNGNGQAFDMNRVNVTAREGTTEVWDLVSRSDAAHPFHLHSYPFQVISRNGQPEPFRAWRDVVNVPSGETVRIAVPFRDFAGRTVFHCHIAEHEDHAMMGVVEVVPQ